jgi:hypothetical protein
VKKVLFFALLMLMASVLWAEESTAQGTKKIGIGYFDNGLDLVYWKNEHKGIQANVKLSASRLGDVYDYGNTQNSWDYRIRFAFLRKVKEYDFLKISIAYGISWSDVKSVQNADYSMYTRTAVLQVGPIFEIFMPFCKNLCLASDLKLNLGITVRTHDIPANMTTTPRRSNTESIYFSGTGFTLDTVSIRYYF